MSFIPIILCSVHLVRVVSGINKTLIVLSVSYLGHQKIGIVSGESDMVTHCIEIASKTSITWNIVYFTQIGRLFIIKIKLNN